MLRINHKSDSIVVDQLPLYLNWSVNYKQNAYNLSVIKDDNVVYVVNKTDSSTTLLIDAFELVGNATYRIEINVYDQEGNGETLHNTFRTGNLGGFSGKWISGGKPLIDESAYYLENRNPILRKHFSVNDEIIASHVNIVGLGYYKLYINGSEVGDHELNTDWTNYSKTVYYDTYDIAHLLKKGRNEALIELGNGWFNPAPLTLFGKYNLRETLSIGEPQAILDLIIISTAETLVVSSDESWDVCEGAYLFNNIYLGETVDFRLLNAKETFSVKNPVWKPVAINDGPTGKRVPSFIPKIKKSAQLTPHHIHVIDEEDVIIDFGKTLTGYIDITVTAYHGQSIELTYSEEINSDYTLKTDSTLAGFIGKDIKDGVIIPGGPGAPFRAEQKDKIICRSGVNRFVNKFTYHSFRYVQIKGLNLDQINSIYAIYVHTGLLETGSFQCSDTYLNALFDIGKQTKLNNIHSVFSDCARERFAYGGDIVALAKSQVYLFDSANLYEKTLYDFVNDIRQNGGVPETAPFMGIKTNGTGGEAGPLGWQLVFPYVLAVHYQHYGNLQLIKAMFPYLERHMEHLSRLSLDELSRCCLGDWGSQDKNTAASQSSSPASHFTTLCFYYYHVILMAKFSQNLDLADKSDNYLLQARQLKNEIIRRYKNNDGSFADGSQTSYVFALYFDLVDDINQAMHQLIHLIKQSGYVVRCGIFGQSFLYEILRRQGHNDVVYQWLHCEQGFKHMLRDESAALKEYFGDNKHGSCNHAMFSSYVSWLYQALGGIVIQDQAIGADRVMIAPWIIDTLDYVECEHQSLRGRIACKWRRFETHIELVINVPFNLKRCTLALDKRYNLCTQDISETEFDESKKYFDITDAGEITLRLMPALH